MIGAASMEGRVPRVPLRETHFLWRWRPAWSDRDSGTQNYARTCQTRASIDIVGRRWSYQGRRLLDVLPIWCERRSDAAPARPGPVSGARPTRWGPGGG